MSWTKKILSWRLGMLDAALLDCAPGEDNSMQILDRKWVRLENPGLEGKAWARAWVLVTGGRGPSRPSGKAERAMLDAKASALAYLMHCSVLLYQFWLYQF